MSDSFSRIGSRASFNEFRSEGPAQWRHAFHGKSDLELRAIYADALQKASSFATSRTGLSRAQQRLLAQAAPGGYAAQRAG